VCIRRVGKSSCRYSNSYLNDDVGKFYLKGEELRIDIIPVPRYGGICKRDRVRFWGEVRRRKGNGFFRSLANVITGYGGGGGRKISTVLSDSREDKCILLLSFKYYILLHYII